MLNKSGKGLNVNVLKSEVEYRTNLQAIANKIHAAPNLDDILVNLIGEITSLFVGEGELKWES